MIEETFSAAKTLPTSSYSAQQSDKFVVNLQEYEIKLTSNWQPKFIVAQFDGQAKALLIRTHPLPGDPVPFPFHQAWLCKLFKDVWARANLMDGLTKLEEEETRVGIEIGVGQEGTRQI